MLGNRNAAVVAAAAPAAAPAAAALRARFNRAFLPVFQGPHAPKQRSA
jgi:hypothetical protein